MSLKDNLGAFGGQLGVLVGINCAALIMCFLRSSKFLMEQIGAFGSVG